MKRFIQLSGLLAMLGAIGVSVSSADDGFELPGPTPEHAWVQQLVGEWEVEGECFMEPGQPPVKSKGRETSRAIGEFWAQSRYEGEVLGKPFTGVFTLGYDPEQKQYLATWTDSMTATLWQYRGTLDAAGKVLVLETEGKCPGDGQLRRFRETIELVDRDHRTFTSEVEVDGQWVRCVRFVYTRVKTK